MENETSTSGIERQAPTPKESRAALVTQWADRVRMAREFWTKTAFNKMREDMSFAAGNQWGNRITDDRAFADAKDDRYVANITLRHVESRTASIYGKNPTVVARRKPRLMATVWDETAQTFQAALQMMQANPMDEAANAVVQDAMMVMNDNKQQTALAKTLELLYHHEVHEQSVPFKVQMKGVVRRALTTGVGYTKLGYQRVMEQSPEVDAQIEIYSQQLATVERISADMTDGEVEENSAKAEELRLSIAALAQTGQVVVREGLTYTYPHSTALIPDPSLQQIRGFIGADWVAEEYFLTSDKIQEIYKKSVGESATSASNEVNPRAYFRQRDGMFAPTQTQNQAGAKSNAHFCVWEIYCRSTGLVYVVCDGYADFLAEPSNPDLDLERFFPWFTYVVNEVYDELTVFPPSDVRLMRDMQTELNRARQGLREHRRAARPKTYVRKGALDDGDKSKVQAGEAHEIIELNALGENQDIKTVLQAHAGPAIDPALYDPSPVYEDYQRALGQQEANLGGTSGATATEASIAEGSRATGASSVVDDLDEFLTELARASGQVLLMNCSAEKVKQVVGPGAVWPELSREEVAREIYLDIEAASTGRPNKGQEVQVAQQIFPLLMQIPGISPEFLAKELLRRMDDRMDLAEAFSPGVPSIMMLNRPPAAGAAGPGAPPSAAQPQDAPANQGAQGGQNSPQTAAPQVNAAPRPPGRPPMVALPGPPT